MSGWQGVQFPLERDIPQQISRLDARKASVLILLKPPTSVPTLKYLDIISIVLCSVDMRGK